MTATLPPEQLRDDHIGSEAQKATVVVEHQTASTDQAAAEPHGERVGAGPKHPADHGSFDAHRRSVGGVSTPTISQKKHGHHPWPAGGGPQSPDQAKPIPLAVAPASGRAHSPEPAIPRADSKAEASVQASYSPATKASPPPILSASLGTPDSATDQERSETQSRSVGGASNVSQVDHAPIDFHGGNADLADPLLALASDVLDDLEKVRIANENRLRQLTRTEEDKDGEERGFGLTLDHPDVARLSALVDLLKDAEKQATNNLTYRMKMHPLGAWVKQAKGVGEKQAARLLATIGDPYWNDLHERPRLVSELWSYCGYGDSAAQVRRKGVKANWSDDAKKRAHLVAEKCKMMLSKPCYSVKGDDGLVSHTVHIDGECTCSRYRVLYDERKSHYAGSVHNRECNRCTGKGQPPAPVGSPRKAAHIDAMALRAVKKEILRDLWREAKSLHDNPGDQMVIDNQSTAVAGVPHSLTSRLLDDTQTIPAGEGSTSPDSQGLRENQRPSSVGGT